MHRILKYLHNPNERLNLTWFSIVTGLTVAWDVVRP